MRSRVMTSNNRNKLFKVVRLIVMCEQSEAFFCDVRSADLTNAIQRFVEAQCSSLLIGNGLMPSVVFLEEDVDFGSDSNSVWRTSLCMLCFIATEDNVLSEPLDFSGTFDFKLVKGVGISVLTFFELKTVVGLVIIAGLNAAIALNMASECRLK